MRFPRPCVESRCLIWCKNLNLHAVTGAAVCSSAGDAVLTVTNLEKLLPAVMTRTSQTRGADKIEHGSSAAAF